MSKEDVSLEDELLQVTEKKSNKKPQKKSKKSKDEDEEDEETFSGEEDNDSSDQKGNNNKRKTKATTKKPLKKRKTDSSSDRESSDDEVYDDGWDEDLMGDDKDREWLGSLPEIEREAILDERYQKRKDMRNEWEVRTRLKAEQRAKRAKEKKDDQKESKRETRETRESNKDRERRDRGTKKTTTEKGKALTELKKKRAKAGLSKTSDSEDDEDGEVEQEEDKDGDYHAPKKTASPERETSKAVEKSTFRDSDDEDDDKGEDRPVTFEEVEQLRISRETLEKWIDKPFFNTLVPGFFVRIGIGMDPATRLNVYRVAQIDSVQLKTSYPLGGKQTSKYLRLMIGNKEKDFKMETISNRPFSESEYKHWHSQMVNTKAEFPTAKDVPKKLETLAAAKDYSYTSTDIENMLQEKKKAGVLPVKLASEKARLMLMRDSETDPEEKAKLVDKLNQIEEMMKEKLAKKKQQSSVLNINQRNREANFFATLEAKIEEKNANSDLDPFSRRRTLPSIVYSSKHKVEDDKKEEPKTEEEETPAPAPPAPTPSLKVSTGLPPVKTSEHDTIDIDIPLNSTPGPTTLPFSLPQSTPTPTTPPFVEQKEKKATLSLTDYMRRRRALE